MYRNVEKKLYPDGPWPALPPCSICRPDGVTLSTKFQLLNPQQINVPVCATQAAGVQWDGVFKGNGGNGCRLQRIRGSTESLAIGKLRMERADQYSYEKSSTVERAYMELQVVASCLGTAQTLIWRGRKFTGPTGAGVYDKWHAPTTIPTYATYGPATMTVVRL
jgi:hypothetical protein